MRRSGYGGGKSEPQKGVDVSALKTKRNSTTAKPEILCVQILEAKPNQMFTEEQRAAVRFLRFNRSVACMECGKKKKVMWTMLCEFYAHSMGQFAVLKSTKTHQPLEAVCGDHLLAPAWPEAGEE